MTAIVDAGAAVDVVLERPGEDVLQRALRDHVGELHAPELFVCETSSAIRKRLLAGGTTTERAQGAIEDVLDLPITRHRHDPLAERAWELRANFSAYDAFYVALAELLGPGAVLITADARLARAVASHTDLDVITP